MAMVCRIGIEPKLNIAVGSRSSFAHCGGAVGLAGASGYMRRILLALLLFLLLAPLPGSQLGRPPPDLSQRLVAVPVADVRPGERVGALTLVEAWELSSTHHEFGGLSGLAATGERSFLMVSDIGYRLRFGLAADGYVTGSSFVNLPPPKPGYRGKFHYDGEALAYDAVTGRYWTAMEGTGEVWSFAADDRRILRTRQRVLESWPDNGGAEAFARLPDGRFISLSESRTARGQREAVLFAGDPRDPKTPFTRFFYETGGQGDVTDAAALPDGRVIILHRRLGLFPVFRTSVAIADPRGIRAGQVMTSRPIAVIRGTRLAENYEGAAVTEGLDGLSLWLVSDDNLQDWQTTRLVRFIIDPAVLVPAKRAAPSPVRP